MTSYTIAVSASSSDEVDALASRFDVAKRELMGNRKKDKSKIELLDTAQRLILPEIDMALPDAVANSVTFSGGDDEDFDDYLRELAAIITELDLPGVTATTVD